jgi:hypothetical protein
MLPARWLPVGAAAAGGLIALHEAPVAVLTGPHGACGASQPPAHCIGEKGGRQRRVGVGGGGGG